MSRYGKNLNSLHIDNKEIKQKYFANGEIIQKIFDTVRKNFTLNDSLFSNYASDIIIVINSSGKRIDILTEEIQEFYNDNNEDFYDIYLTVYEKTNNEKINKTLLQKEIQIIKPSKVLYLGFDYSRNALSKKELDILFLGIGNNSNAETSEYKHINKKFRELLEYTITKNN